MDTTTIPFYAAIVSLFIYVPQLSWRPDKQQTPIVRPVVTACIAIRAVFCAAVVALDVSLLTTGRDIGASLNLVTSSYVLILSAMVIRRFQYAYVHSEFVLLALTSVYFYRDILPLTTFTQQPKDASIGWRLWAKILSLIVGGIVIPLLAPSEYTPIDAEDPTENLNAEQMAPLLSRIVYSFLDSFTFSSFRNPDSIQDRIPSVAYRYQAKYLKKSAFPIVDPFLSKNKETYIFWTMFEFYRRDLLILIVLEALKGISVFVGPFGINRLLSYIETEGRDATVRPWVWILWLLLGPLVQAITSESFTHIATRITVGVETIFVQLLFEHSLRVRFVDDNHDGDRSNKHKSTLAGRINTMATADMGNISNSSSYWITALFLPFQIVLCIVFLYFILDWSALVGFGVLLLGVPLIGNLTKRIHVAKKAVMKKMDERVTKVTEVMSTLRMIKFFGWERKVKDEIQERRREELRYLRWNKLLMLILGNINFYIPIISMLATYATSTLVMHRDLSAAIIFSSLSIFEILRRHLQNFVSAVGTLTGSRVALHRVHDFLHNTDLLDKYTHTSVSFDPPRDVVGVCNADFVWSTSPSARPFTLRVNGCLTFKDGINLITGPTGTGKTSLLMALLGEMRYIPNSDSGDSWFSLARNRGVAYVAQDSWILNETIRDNILFGAAYDEARYKKVLRQCALQTDLDILGAGDMTEVGEKGLTLSGGQKARVTLARAVYSRAQVLLLDDVLAALDVHTAKWVVNECIAGDLIAGRTVLLTTHNLALTKSLASLVVVVGSQGDVSWGDVDNILSSTDLTTNPNDIVEEEKVPLYETRDTLPAGVGIKDDGKLFVPEEINQGHVSRKAFGLFLKNVSSHPVIFWLGLVLSIALQEIILAFLNWYLGFWSSQYRDHDSRDISPSHYLSRYTILILVASLCYSIAYIMWTFGSVRASKVIHHTLVEAITGTTLRWLDHTPTSRVIARSTMDIASVDNDLAANVFRLTQMNVELCVKFAAVVFFTPKFLFPGIIFTVLGGLVGQIYMQAQLPVKRVTANAKSPVIGHFGAAISGAVSIRAYGAEEFFIQESVARLEKWIHPLITFYGLNRWVCIRTEALSGIFTASLAWYLIYGTGKSTTALDTGFSIMTAMLFTGGILTWVRWFNRFEVQANSLERILQYINAEQESKPTTNGVPPAHWPSSGALKVDGLSARYTKKGPEVLHNLTFEVSSGEHVGIVGRTGSGKSSLTLSLLRSIPTEGEVYYDGLATSKLNLDALRSNITIIPQIPELLSGTLRHNLDPFSQYEDAELNDALRASGLYSLQDERDVDNSNINLDTVVSSGGTNLSVGQRQILALARAIVRGSKLLILDEATSAIDYKTDAIIQTSLRTELKSVTLLTVAHRLQTVMDFDRIMVLDSGDIVEFDSPRVLLKKDGGHLRKLVDESSDRKTLYRLAGVET